MAHHRPLVPLPCHPISAMHEMMVPANGPLVSATTITALRSVKVTTPVATVGWFFSGVQVTYPARPLGNPNSE